MKLLAVALVLVAGLARPGVAGEAAAGEVAADLEGLAARLDGVVTDYHRSGQFNGVALVARAGEMLLRGAYGYADRSWCVPHTVASRFQIGSLTKPFMASLVLHLVEEGELDLARPVREYLPDYEPARASPFTLHHLLSHTSGLGDVASMEDFELMMTTPLPTAERLARFCGAAPGEPPGATGSYSNCGYEVVGAVVGSVSGTSLRVRFERFLREMGLTETGFTDTGAVIPRLARGYTFEDGAWRHQPSWVWDNAVASGSLYSTADDLHLWHRRLFGGEILTVDSLKRMIEPVESGYGYGWFVGWGAVEQIDELISAVREAAPEPRARDLHVVAHGGDLPGFHTLLIQILNDPHVVVLLDNQDLTGIYDHRRIAHLGADLVRVLFGVPARGPQPAYGPAVIPRLSGAEIACAAPPAPS